MSDTMFDMMKDIKSSQNTTREKSSRKTLKIKKRTSLPIKEFS